MRIFVLPGANIVQRVGSRELQLTVSCSLQPEPSPLTDLLLAIGYWLSAIGYWLLAIGNWLSSIGYALRQLTGPIGWALFRPSHHRAINWSNLSGQIRFEISGARFQS
jgi:hypothetical protein